MGLLHDGGRAFDVGAGVEPVEYFTPAELEKYLIDASGPQLLDDVELPPISRDAEAPDRPRPPAGADRAPARDAQPEGRGLDVGLPGAGEALAVVHKLLEDEGLALYDRTPIEERLDLAVGEACLGQHFA